MSDIPAVRFAGVTRHFGATCALRGIDLEIPADTVVGVLGPNGGGKTTLLRHIPGLLLPSSGTVTTLGADAARLDDGRLARIGYVSQETPLLGWVTCGELIAYVRAGHPRWNDDLARRLADTFAIDPRRRVGSLSTGERQRLAILIGVAHEPDLLLLDEPASALDPIARQEFLDLVIGMVQVPGRTILISSHILTDVEKVIDRVLILVDGAVRWFGTLDDLRETHHRVDGVVVAGRTREQLDAHAVVTPLSFEEIYGVIAGRR